MDSAPAYWVRQRNGLSVGARVTAQDIEQAVEEARRHGPSGDHLAPTGLVWVEQDARGPGGWSYRTLTPVWESSQPQGDACAH